MYIAHKSNIIIAYHSEEWQCRRMAKSFDKQQYFSWLKSVTDSEGVVDLSGETGYKIVECSDEDVSTRIGQLQDYIGLTVSDKGLAYENIQYDIKWQDDIGNAEEILDADGKSHDPKQYVQSHFVPDNATKDKRILDREWKNIRIERERLLVESDWTQANDTPLSDADVAKWKTYRTSLRDLPSDQSSKTKYSDITWPTKP